MLSPEEVHLELVKLRMQAWQKSGIRRILIALSASVAIVTVLIGFYLLATAFFLHPLVDATNCTTSLTTSSTFEPNPAPTTISTPVPIAQKESSKCTEATFPLWFGVVAAGIAIAFLLPEILSWGGRYTIKVGDMSFSGGVDPDPYTPAEKSLQAVTQKFIGSGKKKAKKTAAKT